MFTGIITDIGKILDTKKTGTLEVTVGCNYELAGIELGASIAHDGVCLTVVEKGQTNNQNWYKVNVSDETINCTYLKESASIWKINSMINLERSLKVGDELGGHIVTGHVDGVAEINLIKDIGDSTRVCFTGPSELARYIAKKGSISLNGTSLTVNATDGVNFEINLIPHTKLNTTWKFIRVGDLVNLEIDPLARYVARLNELGD